MADFYPLLSRAIASLPDNTPEARQSLYERARSVLLSQLRSLDPPLPEYRPPQVNRAIACNSKEPAGNRIAVRDSAGIAGQP